MAYPDIRKLTDGKKHYAGRTWFYDYRHMQATFNEADVAAFAESASQHFARLAKCWSAELNTQWLARMYFAMKLVLSASVMAQSHEYAIRMNLRPVVSYLRYYTVLQSMRAVMLTSPTTAWLDGGILEATHSKTLNVASDVLRLIDKTWAREAKCQVEHLRAIRELISYRAPTGGEPNLGASCDALSLCAVNLEVAQMQSELLDFSLTRHCKEVYEVGPEILDVCAADIAGVYFVDDDDYMRMGYFVRKHPHPANISHMMTEGHVDDFLGAWLPRDEEDAAVFNPDDDPRIVFALP